jgi:hypothetical protein
LKKTQKGRIVYDRKKHIMEAKDCYRIIKKLDVNDVKTDKQEYNYILLIIGYIERVYIGKKFDFEVKVPEEKKKILEENLLELFRNTAVWMIEEILEVVPLPAFIDEGELAEILADTLYNAIYTLLFGG